MTPRQFSLLEKRHKEERAHREMVAAFTTAAVINFSMCRPEDGVSPLDYMPSHKAHESRMQDEELSDEELERQSAFNLSVLQKAAQMKAEASRGNKDG